MDERPKTLTLKAIRINLGWSLEKASVLLGVSPATLSNYERGDTYPNAQTIKRIEEVYKISSQWINFLPNNVVLNDNVKEVQ
ncbi:MAG: helix-turn-helix transcriptional regulator [Clostridiales bacterium]|nr:helix-turn-helix transcriptional regulator [Clostridiales bacterium]